MGGGVMPMQSFRQSCAVQWSVLFQNTQLLKILTWYACLQHI